MFSRHNIVMNDFNRRKNAQNPKYARIISQTSSISLGADGIIVTLLILILTRLKTKLNGTPNWTFLCVTRIQPYHTSYTILYCTLEAHLCSHSRRSSLALITGAYMWWDRRHSFLITKGGSWWCCSNDLSRFLSSGEFF